MNGILPEMVQLSWFEEDCIYVLKAKKRPYCWQPVFARVYPQHYVEGEACWVWQVQGYISTDFPSVGTGVIQTIPSLKSPTAKKALKEVEWYVVRWFKGLGLEVQIERGEVQP